MKRVAVIFESSPFDRKGLFNAVHNRVRGLIGSGECWVDAYCVHSRDNSFTRKIRHTSEAPHVDSVVVEDITYRLLWYRFSIVDHLLVEKLHRRPFFFRSLVKRAVEDLEGYDVLIGHSFTGAWLAYQAHRRYGTPFFANWHGSDIHTHPWRLPMLLQDTEEIMRNAVCNCFVSNALKDFSDRIAPDVCKEVLHNGVSENFVRFDGAERAAARKHFGLEPGDKSVSFAGNLSAVKNVRVLAPLFRNVRDGYDGALKFLVAGDGKLRSSVEGDMRDAGLDVIFSGNLTPEEMPAFMNSTDVLVLPSLNEGLPLVCAEALKCGANVVGSRVGGIPEVIGVDHTVPLGDGFVQQMGTKVVEMLGGGVVQDVPESMSWEMSSKRELELISNG